MTQQFQQQQQRDSAINANNTHLKSPQTPTQFEPPQQPNTMTGNSSFKGAGNVITRNSAFNRMSCEYYYTTVRYVELYYQYCNAGTNCLF